MSHRTSSLGSLALAFAALSALGSAGCATRTVYVVDGDRPTSTPAPSEAASVASGSVATPVPDVAGVDQFYEPLNPYGRWYPHATYGSIWVPSRTYAGVGWRPYTQGYWAQTEYGWTWVSNEPFGWATYHYGRWYYDAMYGWVWVPGTQWGPAWVTWRTGGGYVGWAPMGPGAYYGGSYVVYDSAWVFVTNRHFGSPVITHVIIVDRYDECLRETQPDRTVVNVGTQPIYRGPEPDRITNDGGNVVRRPIREIDQETPTSTPPSGTVVDRRPNRDGGGHDGTSTAGDTPSGTRNPPRGSDDRTGGSGTDDRSGGSTDDRSGGSGTDDRSGGAVAGDGRSPDRTGRDTGTGDSGGIPGLDPRRPGGSDSGPVVDDRSGGGRAPSDDRSGGTVVDDRTGGSTGPGRADGPPPVEGDRPGRTDGLIDDDTRGARDPRDTGGGRTPTNDRPISDGRTPIDGRTPVDGRTPDDGRTRTPDRGDGRATDPRDVGPFVPAPRPEIPDASNRIPVDTSGPPSSIPPPSRSPDTRGVTPAPSTSPPRATPAPSASPPRAAPAPTTSPSRGAPPRAAPSPSSTPSRAAPAPSSPQRPAPAPAPKPAKKEEKKREKKSDDKGDKKRGR